MFSKEEEKRIRSTSSQLIEQHTDVDVTKVLTMGIEALDEFGPDRKEDFDKFLEYLDSKSAYLKTKTRPLNSHELKKMAMLDAKIKGKDVSNEEWNFD